MGNRRVTSARRSAAGALLATWRSRSCCDVPFFDVIATNSNGQAWKGASTGASRTSRRLSESVYSSRVFEGACTDEPGPEIHGSGPS
jgi:hypothetical protein